MNFNDNEDRQDEKGLDVTLPFSPPKQQSLLGHLLTNEKFFVQARTNVKTEWWVDGRHASIWKLANNWYTQYKRAASPTELINCSELLSYDQKEIKSIQTGISMCVQCANNFPLDALSLELAHWMKTRLFLAGMRKSEEAFNVASRKADVVLFSNAYDIVKSTVRAIDDISFERGQTENMGDAEQDVRGLTISAEKAITFGLPVLDMALLPEGNGKGSLLSGDMTILLSPTNAGKTSTMIAVICSNLIAGKDVLFIAHEGKAMDLRMKIRQCLMGLSRNEIIEKSSGGDDAFRQELAYVTEHIIGRHLEFICLNGGSLTCEEVEAVVERRQERWKGIHNKGFDLLVDDYPAKLTTIQSKGGQYAFRQVQEIVYNTFTQMALKYDFHVLCAIQTNREGSKINNRSGHKDQKVRLLTMEDVMESWGPMTTATNVITINRDPEAQARNIITFYICKSRSSKVGIAVVCQSDFSRTRPHWETAKAAFYTGTAPLSQNAQALLERFDQKEIPWEEVRKFED